jgi:hypothetical protein
LIERWNGMDNSPKKTGSPAPASKPSFNLAERLLRRAAEPAGVIDVRQPQRIYERSAGWVARRFALLDHWRTRYGDQPATGGGDEMTFAVAPALRASSGAFPDVTTLARAAAPPGSNPDAPRFDTGVAASPSPALRVSRRGARTANAPGETARPNAPDETAKPGDSGTVSLFSETSGESRAVAIAATPDPARSGDSTPNHQSELTTENFYQAPAVPVERVMNPEGAAPPREQRAFETPALPLAREIRAEAPPVSLQLQRRHSAETVGTARSREITRDSTADMRLSSTGSSRAPDSPVVFAVNAETAMNAPGAVARQAGGEVTDPGPGATVAPLAPSMSRPSAAPQAIQRREESRQAGGRPLSEQYSPAINVQAPQSPVVAREIPAASSGAPEPALIWRKSAGDESNIRGATTGGAVASSLPLKIEPPTAIAPAVSRQIGADAESGVGAAPGMGAEPPARAGEVDVAQLAEQIGRLLSRQLAVERERRGMK